MASRTKQKEAARARRMAEEQARLERESRQRQLRIVSGVIVLAVAVVAVFIAVSSGGSSGATGLQKGTQLQKTEASVSNLLAGVHQSGTTLGNASAPITMTYYGDLECPICRDFTLNGGFAKLVSNDVRAGKVKVVYKAFCTATCNGPGQGVFTTQQAAAIAAGQQNRFWNYTELFYHEQGAENTGYVTDSYLQGLAAQTPGLNLAQWNSARGSTTNRAQVTSEEQAAGTAGVSSTPTLVFTGPTGKSYGASGPLPYSDLQSLMKKVS